MTRKGKNLLLYGALAIGALMLVSRMSGAQAGQMGPGGQGSPGGSPGQGGGSPGQGGGGSPGQGGGSPGQGGGGSPQGS